MIILGLNAYHADASACIVKDGKLLIAIEEERLRRIKHWAGFPDQSIAYCLKEVGCSLSDIDHIAINRDPKANLIRKAVHSMTSCSSISLLRDRFTNAKAWSSIEDELHRSFASTPFKGRMHHIEHHLAHLASSFLVSPYDQAVSVSVDGSGDFSSTAWGLGVGNHMDLSGRVYFPHSLGVFYQAMTQFIGFPNYGDEYKVMGLAPYGKPVYLDEMRKLVLLQQDGTFKLALDYFIHHKGRLNYKWNNCMPSIGNLYSKKLTQLLGSARAKEEPLQQKHMDLARSIQAMYEEAFFHLLNKLHEKFQVDYLCLSGGCAMNSVANGKVLRNTPFEKLYIQSAAGDAGGAIGAAFEVWHGVLGNLRSYTMKHAYLGPKYSQSEIQKVLELNKHELEQAGCQVSRVNNEEELCGKTAQAIADGKVIGWFQGRMEWGPRSLGNRSILGDPRRADMKDILNLKIKRRESFRPFAPSILRESVAEWFEGDDDVPFMMKVFQVQKEKRSLIPAVTHEDGSGRLQTVSVDSNAKYYRLITAFKQLTGVPMLLNTSFNENEPVVCQPVEALNCFLRTKMDVLVLGDFYIERI